ncbi:MAG: hypothetical protein HZA50_01315 [Planctomycetes bacterium]|nr:hypothetical protein [Planctomycetota bacterium]
MQEISAIRKIIGTILIVISAGLCIGQPATSRPAGTAGGNKPASAPASDLEYWLGQAKPPQTQPAASSTGKPGDDPGNPFGPRQGSSRPDALPGVVELSDGRLLAGWLFTTAEKDWEVWVEANQRWVHVPFLAVSAISAVVVEEKMELFWRWKGMGEPERVYTGQKYPTRRLQWKFHLIDGSYVTGDVKGQPLWVEFDGRKSEPMIIQERSKGEVDTELKDLVYVKTVIVSRHMMDLAARAGCSATAPASR